MFHLPVVYMQKEGGLLLEHVSLELPVEMVYDWCDPLSVFGVYYAQDTLLSVFVR